LDTYKQRLPESKKNADILGQFRPTEKSLCGNNKNEKVTLKPATASAHRAELQRSDVGAILLRPQQRTKIEKYFLGGIKRDSYPT